MRNYNGFKFLFEYLYLRKSIQIRITLKKIEYNEKNPSLADSYHGLCLI